MSRPDRYLIEVPPLGSNTDHWNTQLASQTLLIKSGVSDLVWHSSSNTGRQVWYARCDPVTLMQLGLHGCIIKKNASADARKVISNRIKSAVDALFLSLSQSETNEVSRADIIQQFTDAINNR